ncbi:MAG: amidohydrolase family protein [Oscillospiraceae bacterium]|nr:amidohydrolase family protein [Oscillospiraceae bacterium]
MKPLKKIDIHAHAIAFPGLTPDHKATGFPFPNAEDMIRYYDGLGIERGVLLPMVSPEAQWFTTSSEEMKWLSDQHPGRFSWFCNVDPRAGDNSPGADLGYLLEHYKKLGARGLGELTANIYAGDPRMDNLFGCCAALGLPVTIHIAPKEGGYYGIVDDLHLPRIERMLKKHPDLKLLGHSQAFWSEISADNTDETRGGYPTGKVTEGRVPKLMREYPNLCCDLSAGSGANAMMRDPEFAAGFLTEFADRIYYGCDICGPNHPFAAKFSDFLAGLADSKMITEEVYDKICRGNAEKLLGL